MRIKKLYIYSESGAAKHIPDRPTLVVRLEGTVENPCPPLYSSPHYTVLDYGSVADGDMDEFLSPNVLSANALSLHHSSRAFRRKDLPFDEQSSQLFESLDYWVSHTADLFDVGTARRMILDFERHYRSVDALLVHCAFGATRSPTYALAMNDLFGLGFNSLRLRQKYKLLSQYMYRTLMDVGSTMVE